MGAADVLVIGGGISGMSFAHYCARAGRQVTVLERAAVAGGCLDTHRTPAGYWYELGAHTLYNSYQGLLGILEARDLLGALLPRAKVPFRLWEEAGLCSIPSRLRWGELLRGAPKILSLKKQGRTVRGYYGPLVGTRNYQDVFGPLFSAVFSQRADDFPAEMMFKKRGRRKDVLRSFTLQGGLRTVTDRIGEDPAISVQTGHEVTALHKDSQGYRAELSDGSSRQAKAVALAIPASSAEALLRKLAPKASLALSGIGVSTVENVGVAVRQSELSIEKVAGIIPLDGSFFSAVSRDTVPDAAWRGFAFHFHPGMTSEKALEKMGQVLKVAPSRLEHFVHTRSQLPAPGLGHQQVVDALDQSLAGTGLYLTGNYFSGLSIEDCVLRSKAEAGRLLGSLPG